MGDCLFAQPLKTIRSESSKVFTLFIIFHLAEIGCEGCWSIGWFFYLVFVTVATSVRLQCRDRFNIIGNPFEDFFATLFLYPCVAVQLDETTKCIKKDNFKQKQINVEMAGKKKMLKMEK